MMFCRGFDFSRPPHKSLGLHYNTLNTRREKKREEREREKAREDERDEKSDDVFF
jgi:hypothetical protein